MIARRGIFPLLITSLLLLVVFSFRQPLASIEDQVTSMRYGLRGVQRADTNIVIVYIDNDAIPTLGYPVRRNFYALMIKALADLNVRAIGIDVLFEVSNSEYPEYDDLLAHVSGTSGFVVFASYFRTVEKTVSVAGRSTTSSFSYPNVAPLPFHGQELHLPLSPLMSSAAGVGHVNIIGQTAIPALVGCQEGIVTSLGMELIRVSTRTPRDAVRYDGRRVTMHNASFALDGDEAELNFPGDISAFTTYPFLEVLRSYDVLRGGGSPAIPLQRFNDKIVLLGVIAEGRTETFATPMDPRFPALGLHAVFLDNALRSGFLQRLPEWLLYLLCAVLGMGCSAAILFLAPPLDKVVSFGGVLLIVVISFTLFLVQSYIFPLVPLLLVGITGTISSMLYRHRFVHKRLNIVQAEKEVISTQLRDKEAKLALLERELLDFETAKSSDRTAELMEEIRKYKAEIRSLSLQADDMEEAEKPAGENAPANFEGIVYERTGKIQQVVDFISKIAASDAPVLILGQSGTGKELVAHAIHNRSDRSTRPFIAVNCGALSESLLESELFGHEKGAFTGAVKDKFGRFELADGGTIFLDEIGEVNEAFQLKLLRVLQEGEFERVGGTKTINVDIRVLAATNKDLKAEVKAKKFREDLYYRLNVLTIELPPLKDRQEDIALLVRHFLNKEDRSMNVSKNVLETLMNYQWHGNIRELESVIKRAVLMAKADRRLMVTMKDLTEEVATAVKDVIALQDQVLESLREKRFSRSSVTETADELGGLNRGTVAEYLRGECFKAFVENGYRVESAVQHISFSDERDVNDRVGKRMREYLKNIADAIDTSQPWDSARAGLKSKSKNLPQRYHPYLEKIAEAFYRGIWKIEE